MEGDFIQESITGGMEEIQESTEEVVRDYKTKRMHGRTEATKSGSVSLEYQGRVIANRRYSSCGERRRIVEYWRECHINFSEMAILIVPDNY